LLIFVNYYNAHRVALAAAKNTYSCNFGVKSIKHFHKICNCLRVSCGLCIIYINGAQNFKIMRTDLSFFARATQLAGYGHDHRQTQTQTHNHGNSPLTALRGPKIILN